MKTYSGYETSVHGKLKDDLIRTGNTGTLYVSHYFFALNDGAYLIFYYNQDDFLYFQGKQVHPLIIKS